MQSWSITNYVVKFDGPIVCAYSQISIHYNHNKAWNNTDNSLIAKTQFNCTFLFLVSWVNGQFQCVLRLLACPILLFFFVLHWSRCGIYVEIRWGTLRYDEERFSPYSVLRRRSVPDRWADWRWRHRSWRTLSSPGTSRICLRSRQGC